MKCLNISWVAFPVLLLVFLFSTLFPVYSEVILTDEEWTTLLDERKFLKSELANFKENYNSLDQKYEALDLKYSNLDKKYETLELESKVQKIESSLRTESLAILKKETIWNDIGWFLAGFGTGFATGNYTGFKIGVTINP